MLCFSCSTELTKSTLDEVNKISVETKRLRVARTMLQKGQKRFLILAGHQGDGLSTLGKALLLDYPDRDPYVLMEPHEALSCIPHTRGKQVIMFADEMLGTTYFDEKRFEDWSRIMKRLSSYIKHNTVILIMSLCLDMLKEAKCKWFHDFYQHNVLNVSQPALQLDRKEMKQILKRNILSQAEILKIDICKSKCDESLSPVKTNMSCERRPVISEETIEEIACIALPSGFPGAISRFLTSVDNLKNGVKFFSMPSLDMYHEINKWQTDKVEDNLNKFIALIAVFVCGIFSFDKFKAQIQAHKEPKTYSTSCAGKRNMYQGVMKVVPSMIRILKEFVRIHGLQETLMSSVGRGIKLLEGRFLKEFSKGHYVIASVSVEKVVAIICARVNAADVCTSCSRAVFNDIVGPDAAFENKELHISVQKKNKNICQAVMKRLHAALTSSKILEVIHHPSMRVSWFSTLFITYLKHQDDLKTLVMKTDDTTETNVLALSLDCPYTYPGKPNTHCFAEDIILTADWLKIKKNHPGFARELEIKTLEKCCELRWENSYFHLTEVFAIPRTETCLFHAVKSTSSSIVKDLLTQNTFLFSDDDLYLALRYAFVNYNDEDEDTKKILNRIMKKINIDYSSETTESILHHAGRNGDVILLGKAVAFYTDKNIRNLEGKTCIHLAAQGNHIMFVSLALKLGVSQTTTDLNGELPIHYASKHGFVKIAEILLLDDPEVVNAVSNNGSTPLHLAARNNHLAVSDLLMRHGANIYAYDALGQTPAYYATQSGATDVLEYFLKRGLDSVQETANGDNLFIVATRAGNIAGMRSLLNSLPEEEQKQRLLADSVENVLCGSEETSKNFNNKCNALFRLIEMGADPKRIQEIGTPLLQMALKRKCEPKQVRLSVDQGCENTMPDLSSLSYFPEDK